MLQTVDRIALRRARPCLTVALLGIVAGGGISAVLAHVPARAVMWLVAYLVLVVGVAQGVLALVQAHVARQPPSRALMAAQCIVFNLANALVMAGTMLVRPAWVTVGAVLLVLALGLFLRGVRGSSGALVQIYRLLVATLAISALVGVALALLRARG
jgi:hypothetical protein